MKHSETTDSYLVNQVSEIWTAMKAYFQKCSDSLDQHVSWLLEKKESAHMLRMERVAEEFHETIAKIKSSNIQQKVVVDFLLKDKAHLQKELSELRLAHDILEYTMLNLTEERAFMVERMKLAMLEQSDEY